MERLIRFPLPSYCNCIDSVQDLAQKPYCLCYQYDVNEYGYGPYGFYTDKSEAVLKSLFNNVYYWNKSNFVEHHSWYLRWGLYFYNEKPWIASHIKAICNSDGHFKADVLNELINQNVKFFISHFFTPETGDTFILFDSSLTTKMPVAAEKHSVEFCDVGAIDELCAW